jgi:hypothetical protein
LVNSIKFLAEPITLIDIKKMEDAKQGVFELTWEERHALVERTERFHYVTKVDEVFCCICRDFYYSSWCFQSAIFQHSEFLYTKGHFLRSRPPLRGKAARKMSDRKFIQAAQKNVPKHFSLTNIKYDWSIHTPLYAAFVILFLQ